MRPVTAKISIDAPRERVFDLVADLANRPAFFDHFAEDFHLQRLESRGVGAAARFHADATLFPIWMETVVTELEPPHTIIERGRGSRADRMALGFIWELVEGPAATTDLSVTFWAEPGNPFDKVRSKLGGARWYRKHLRKALRRLRDVIESDQPIEPLHVAGTSRI
jgi:uncharacterized protein YndB with AHSA1/START domain